MANIRGITATSFGFAVSLEESDSDSETSEFATPSPSPISDRDYRSDLAVLRASPTWRETTVSLKRKHLELCTSPTWPRFVRESRIAHVTVAPSVRPPKRTRLDTMMTIIVSDDDGMERDIF